MRWAGHIALIGDRRGASYGVLVGWFQGKRLSVDKMIILKRMCQKMNTGHGLHLDDYRERWWKIVNSAINFGGSIKCGEFLDYLKTR